MSLLSSIVLFWIVGFLVAALIVFFSSETCLRLGLWMNCVSPWEADLIVDHWKRQKRRRGLEE